MELHRTFDIFCNCSQNILSTSSKRKLQKRRSSHQISGQFRIRQREMPRVPVRGGRVPRSDQPRGPEEED